MKMKEIKLFSQMKLFYKIYFLSLAAVLIVASITLAVLYNWLIAYEKSSPQGFVDKIATALEKKDASLFDSASKKALNDFESSEHIEAFLAEECNGKNIRVEKGAKYTSKKPVFTAYADASQLFTVELKQSDKKSFGMNLWEIDSFSQVDYAVKQLNIYMPQNAEIYINEKKADDKNSTVSQSAQVTEYLDAAQAISVPEMKKITVDGFFAQPQISAKVDGKEAYVYKLSEGEYRISAMSESQLKEAHHENLEEFSKIYATYTSDDGSFSKLSKYLIKDTQTYENLRTMEVYWFTNHDRYDFKNFNSENYVAYDENSFSCHVTFDYYVYRGAKEYHYPSCDTFYFTMVDGQYKLCSMTLD